jgi:hypothetical protein
VSRAISNRVAHPGRPRVPAAVDPRNRWTGSIVARGGGERLDLGFVDLLSCEGGSTFGAVRTARRRTWCRAAGAGRAVTDPAVRTSVGAIFRIPREAAPEADPAAVRGVLEQIGLGPKGKPWDCGACGYSTCKAFARGVVRGHDVRLCPVQREIGGRGARGGGHGRADGAGPAGAEGSAEPGDRAQQSGDRFAASSWTWTGSRQLNDQYGHAAGTRPCRRWRRSGRRSGHRPGVRYGGDEFVVILARTDLPGATVWRRRYEPGGQVGQRRDMDMGR